MSWSSGECEVSALDFNHALTADIQARRYSGGPL